MKSHVQTLLSIAYFVCNTPINMWRSAATYFIPIYGFLCLSHSLFCGTTHRAKHLHSNWKECLWGGDFCILFALLTFLLKTIVQTLFIILLIHKHQMILSGVGAWSNERGCLLFQKSEMAGTKNDTESVRAQWADTLFRWKIKNSQQISHMTGRCCWVRSMLR